MFCSTFGVIKSTDLLELNYLSELSLLAFFAAQWDQIHFHLQGRMYEKGQVVGVQDVLKIKMLIFE